MLFHIHNHIFLKNFLYILFLIDQPMVAENFDLENVVTPVHVCQYEKLLLKHGYDRQKTEFLVNGFKNGFFLNYKGATNVRRYAPNLKLRIGSRLEVWNKVMVEVKAKRFAGPFKEPPFECFIQSPIGLVPKDKGRKTRLIFHLSYPRQGKSVNSGIPKEFCSVKYPDFNEAVMLCIEVGIQGKVAKSDMSMAFRNVPMNKESWPWLVLMAYHPVRGEKFYFVDKCMPFGSSISCAIFQEFSNSIAFLVKCRTGKPLINYLDDHFIAAINRLLCNRQIQHFLDVCQEVNFPVSMEKTEWATDCVIFLGLLCDLMNQVVCIPKEKVMKALDMLEFFLNAKNHKVTVLQIQKLCGTLNFLCRCVIPGRAFLTRIYALTQGSKLRQHHHVRLNVENKLDLLVWKRFLTHPSVYCRPFMDSCNLLTATQIDMYSDASRNFQKGFGAYCNKEWTFGQWQADFMVKAEPSIEYLELFGVTVAVDLWIHKFENQRICLFCDNMSVVHMINNNSSKCKNCMVLIRLITLKGMIHNVRIFAKHVSTKDNGKADALSRLDFKRFWSLDPGMDEKCTEIPRHLWPLDKIWVN